MGLVAKDFFYELDYITKGWPRKLLKNIKETQNHWTLGACQCSQNSF